MSEKSDDHFVRIAIRSRGVRTSISLDGLLADYLTQKLGSTERLRGWVQETIENIERKDDEAAQFAPIGARLRAKTGLSRAIQREIFRVLFKSTPDLPPPPLVVKNL